MHQPYYTRQDRTQKKYTVQQAVEYAEVYLQANGWACRRLPGLPPPHTAITLQKLNYLQEKVVDANWGAKC